MSSAIYDLSATAVDGTEQQLAQFKGQVLLVVNTASACGFTPQYAGLQTLHEQLHERGFSVLGFPCNQFGKQEPGTADDIKAFCDARFQISFPLFDKVDVNGAKAHPLFKHLKTEAPGALGSKGIKWNFTKFLIDADGNVLSRFAPTTKPEDIRERIEQLLDTRSSNNK